MAGDWIKLEHSTPDKPEVHRLADLLGIHSDQALGVLVRFWLWCDRNSRDGRVTHVYAKPLEALMHCAGFVAAMVDVGWLELDDKSGKVTIPNFDRHNGNTAKTRALHKDRQRRYRDAAVTQGGRSRDAQSSLEKRREDNKGTTRPDGFADFWTAYPRKVAKQDAIKAWNKLRADDVLRQRIGVALQAQCRSQQWLRDNGAYIPYPASWLNDRRWEDEIASVQPERKVVL